MTTASEHQPPPRPGRKRVLDYVIRDLIERAEVGRGRYGTYLMTHNGRDALMDAYQESLDLAMYIKQEIIERERRNAIHRTRHNHSPSNKKARPTTRQTA